MERQGNRVGWRHTQSGPHSGEGAAEIRGGLQGNLPLVLTDQAEWLPNPSEQIPDCTPSWVNISSRWTARALHGGGDGRAGY